MQGKRAALALGTLAFAMLVQTGCERPRPPVNGIAGFELAKTTLADVQPRSLACNQGDNYTRCWIDARQSIMGRVPQIELDFAGKNDLLAEIKMEIPGCRLDELEAWFVDKLGNPTEKGKDRVIWAQKYMFLLIEVAGPARCHVTAVAPEDTERVERVKS